jgi:hypothetical protein
MASHHNIDCLVDTTPMAKKIQEVGTEVKQTTVAVVAMKTAVIAAEKEGSQHVCQNVNRGFFTLMQSQLATKMAQKKSRTEALLAQLAMQKRRLAEIKTSMENDYRRISARYGRIIGNINKQLEQRIVDLDKPVYKFCTNDIAACSNRKLAVTGIAPLVQKEDVQAAQRITSSVLRSDGEKAIGHLKEFLMEFAKSDNEARRHTIESIPAEDNDVYLPFVIMSGTVDDEGTQSLYITPPEDVAVTVAQRSVREISSHVNTQGWTPTQPVSSEAGKEFQRMLAESALPDRVKKMMKTLSGQSSSTNN